MKIHLVNIGVYMEFIHLLEPNRLCFMDFAKGKSTLCRVLKLLLDGREDDSDILNKLLRAGADKGVIEVNDKVFATLERKGDTVVAKFMFKPLLLSRGLDESVVRFLANYFNVFEDTTIYRKTVSEPAEEIVFLTSKEKETNNF